MQTLQRPFKFGGTPLVTLFVVLVALTPLLNISALRNIDLPRYPLLAAVAGFGLLFFTLDLWHERRSLVWHPLLSLISALFAWAMMSAMWTLDPAHNAIETTQLTGMVLLALLAAQIGNDKNTLLLLSVATVSASIAALIGLGHSYGFNPFGLRMTGPMASTFYMKNHAAMYFDFIVPPAFILVLIARTRALQWLAAMGLALCGSFILCCRTRGSWLGLGVTGVALLIVAWKILPAGWLWRLVRERSMPLLFATAFSLTLFLLPSQIGAEWRRAAAPNQVVDESSMTRLQLYYNALPMVAQRPLLGVGLGAFRKAYRPYMNSKVPILHIQEDLHVERLHNEPLQVLVELGLIGGLLAGACYISALRLGVTNMTAGQEHPQTLLLALALTLGLVASGVHSFVDFPYHRPSSAIHFWLSLGLLVGLSTAHGATRTISLKKVYCVCVMVLTILFLAHNTNFYIQYLCSSYHAWRAEKNLAFKRCDSAIYFIDKAVQEFDILWSTHSVRTRIYAACEKDPERLLDVMNEELAYESTNTRALLTRADVYRSNGFNNLARSDYSQVVDLFPQRASAYVGLARLAIDEEHLADALSLLDKAIKNEPQHKDAFALRAETAAKIGSAAP